MTWDILSTTLSALLFQSSIANLDQGMAVLMTFESRI